MQVPQKTGQGGRRVQEEDRVGEDYRFQTPTHATGNLPRTPGHSQPSPGVRRHPFLPSAVSDGQLERLADTATRTCTPTFQNRTNWTTPKPSHNKALREMLYL